MTFSKRYLYLTIPVVILAAFFLLPKIQHIFKPEKQREAIQKYKERQNQSLENWRNANYVPIEHDDAFETKVRETIYQHKEARSLTSLQRQSLARATIQFIYAHHDGTWESFRAFRIPIDKKHVRVHEQFLNRDMTKNVLNRLSSEGKPPGPPMELYETVWKRYVNVAKYVDNGMPVYCTRCWKFIDLETLQLNVDNITKKIPSIGSYIGTNAFGNYRAAPNLAFVPSSENLLENKGAVKLIFVTFLVRTNQQTNYPVDISFYWSSSHRKWLPREFVIGHVTPSIHYFF